MNKTTPRYDAIFTLLKVAWGIGGTLYKREKGKNNSKSIRKKFRTRGGGITF